MTLVSTPAGWLAYSRTGSGPAIVLIHGLGSSRRTWLRLSESLARLHTVIAVDLPGHGESDAPAAGYSPAAHATAIRDLLAELSIEQATLVGHSLGGGVAMQFAYQYPDLADRLVLISPGGLGSDVSPLLRMAVLPGASHALDRVSRLPDVVGRLGLELATRTPWLSADDFVPLREAIGDSLATEKGRRTFILEARSVLDPDGQAVSASGQLEMLSSRPLLLVWGGDDRTIPPRHFRELVRKLPAITHLEIPHAGHFPHESEPEAVLSAIEGFLVETAGADSAAAEASRS